MCLKTFFASLGCLPGSALEAPWLGDGSWSARSELSSTSHVWQIRNGALIWLDSTSMISNSFYIDIYIYHVYIDDRNRRKLISSVRFWFCAGRCTRLPIASRSSIAASRSDFACIHGLRIGMVPFFLTSRPGASMVHKERLHPVHTLLLDAEKKLNRVN